MAIKTNSIRSTVIDYSIYGSTGSAYFIRAGALADLNNDGKNEFVFSITLYPQVSAPLLVVGDLNGKLNLSDVFFPNGATMAMHSPQIVFQDINGDGRKDIVVADVGNDVPPWVGTKIGIAINGGGFFNDISNLIPATTNRNEAVAIGNFDGSGRTQILLSNLNAANQQLYPSIINYSNNTFQITNDIFPLWNTSRQIVASMAASDFNGDKFDDLLIGGSWTSRNNVIVYGTSKGLDFSNISQLPVGPFGQDNYLWSQTGLSWPPTKIQRNGNTNSIVFDFNHDGRPDIFSITDQEDYYPAGSFTRTSELNGTWNPFTGPKGEDNGGLYYGHSAFSMLRNIDGKNFSSSIPEKSDLGQTFYPVLFETDINSDGNTDVIGLYFTLIQKSPQLFGTTFFLNDGRGNFKAVDASTVFPELAVARYHWMADKDNYKDLGTIIPISNGPEGFVGLQLFSSAYPQGQFTVNEFTSPQLTIKNLSPDPILISDREKASSILTFAMNDVIKDKNTNLDFTKVDGGAGVDTMVYSGKLADYLIAPSAGEEFKIVSKTSSTVKLTDYLKNIERLQFFDSTVAIDINGNAGITAKILGAVFGKESLLNKNYIGIGLSFLDSGWTYDNLAVLALDAAGAKTNDQIVSLLWTNVIGFKPSAADKAPFIALLENGMTAGALAHMAADTSFNTSNINLVGLAQTGIEYIPFG